MPTEVLRVLDRSALDRELQKAGRILRRGGLVAFPTETVYGIAVSAEIPEAVERLYRLKGRPRTKPMTIMVADAPQVLERCGDIPATARVLMKRFWPGPLTLVLKDREGHLTGFRLPNHPLARGLVREARVPLLVPSANPSDWPPATTAEQVLRYFPEELDLVIDAGPAEGGVASTVVQVVAREPAADATAEAGAPTPNAARAPAGDAVEILREGAIPESRIREPGHATLLFVCRGNTDRSPIAAALMRLRLSRQLGCEPRELESKGFRVLSAGVGAQDGRRASAHARRVAKEWAEGPIDLDGHVSRKLTTDLVNEATRIYCMERAQRDEILAFFPHRDGDVLLVDPEGADIEDPAGLPVAEYRKLIRRLDAATTLIGVATVARTP